MDAINSEHNAALRYAIELRDYTDELLNRDAVHGVEFGEVRESIENLYVTYPNASHLLGGGRPTHVPRYEQDPGLHFLARLAFEISALPKTVRLRDAVRILERLNFLAVALIRALTGDRTA